MHNLLVMLSQESRHWTLLFNCAIVLPAKRKRADLTIGAYEMNSTTTNYAVPRISTVLAVGSVWLMAFTAIMTFHLISVVPAEEFATTLIATIGVAFAAIVAIRSAVLVWRSEKSDEFAESLPRYRHPFDGCKVKAA